MPDLRGLGDSERSEGIEAYRKNELAKDVISVIDELGLEQFDLVGHDWGGAVAQEIALAFPERVKRLVIMNISIINNRQGNIKAQTKLNALGNRVNWYQHFQSESRLPEAMIPGNEETWLRFFLRPNLPEDAIKAVSYTHLTLPTIYSV